MNQGTHRAPVASELAAKSHRNARTGHSSAVRQSPCAVCGKTALPGSAIVRECGARGRVHVACANPNN
jgi:hypothetical protein